MRLEDLITIPLLTVVPFIFILYFTVGLNGSITLEKTYLNEFNECQENLKLEEEKNTPECAPVEIKQGAAGMITTILGSILWVSGLVFWFFFIFKKQEALIKQEKELNEKANKKRGKSK